jgi:hypothetical protein
MGVSHDPLREALRMLKVGEPIAAALSLPASVGD